MIKTKLFILLGLFSLSSTFAQTENRTDVQNHLKDLRLKGDVKTFKITPYKVVDYFGKIVKGDKQDFWTGDVVVVFDEKGYKIETNRYNKVGQLSQKVIYKYDEQGKRIVRDVYNSFGKIQMKYMYVYDDRGSKTAYNSYTPTGKLHDTYQYLNDDKGRMIQELWTKSDKTFGLKYTFEYDAKGQVTKTCQYTKDANTLDNCTAYKYDKSGNIVELEIFKSNGDLKRKQVIKYDNKGNEINVRNFDENGNFIDERNYKYQYDEKGNWVERIEYINDFPKALIEREFIYYK